GGDSDSVWRSRGPDSRPRATAGWRHASRGAIPSTRPAPTESTSARGLSPSCDTSCTALRFSLLAENDDPCSPAPRRLVRDRQAGLSDLNRKGVEMDLGLGGKVALVTGGTNGLGRAMVERLITEGASVVTCGRDPGRVRALCQGIDGHGGSLLALQAD